MSSLTLTPNVAGGVPLALIPSVLDGTGIWIGRDAKSLDLPPPSYDETYAVGRRTSSIPQNLPGALAGFLGARNAPDYADLEAALIQTVEMTRRNGGVLAYSAGGLDTIYYDVESASMTELPQDGVMIEQRMAAWAMSLNLRPYGRLAAIDNYPLSILDGFSYDTLTNQDWRWDTGSGTLSISGGQLVPSSTTRKTIWRPVTVLDSTATLEFHIGASIGSMETSVVAKRLATGNDRIFVDARTSGIWIYQDDGGASTSRGSVSWTPETDTTYWLQAQMSGNTLTGRIYDADPNGPSPSDPLGTVSYTFTGADATKFGTGIRGNPGLDLIPGGTDFRYDNFRVDVPGTIRTSEPLLDAVVCDVPGSVPALPTFKVADAATQARGHVEFAEDDRYFETADPQPVLIDSDVLTVSGYAGTGSTRSGAYNPDAGGNSVIHATLIPTVQGLCATGTLRHRGPRRVKVRVGTTGTGPIYVRQAYRIADGDWNRDNGWVKVPDAAVGNWAELDLGVAQIPASLIGTQSWETKLEAYSVTAGDVIDVDYIEVLPAVRWGKAVASVSSEPAAGLAYDGFQQAAGVLTGKTPPVGGTNWAGAGDADDWNVTGGTTAYRWAAPDATGGTPTLTNMTAGRRMYLAIADQAAVDVVCNLAVSNMPYACESWVGPFARYDSTNNYWVMAVVRNSWTTRPPEGGYTYLNVYKKTSAGAPVQVGPTITLGSPQLTGNHDVKLSCNAAGDVIVYHSYQGGQTTAYTFATGDNDLKTGGSGILDSGKVGFYGGTWNLVSVGAGYGGIVNDFAALTQGATGSRPVIASGGNVRLRHDAVYRDTGSEPLFVGAWPSLNPAGAERRANQVVVKAKRNDVDIAADDQIADLVDVSLETLTPRVVLLG